jgi:hypothetical protein
MKKIVSVYSVFVSSTRILVLVGFIWINLLTSVHAAPPSSAFGVWDRGYSFDSKEYPFLKGMTFNGTWDKIEKMQGSFDWRGLDQAVEKAFQNKMYLYLSLEAGPGSPDWIYKQGVPRVLTAGGNEKEKWPCYPYYLSSEYKKYYATFIAEAGKHIRSYPKEKQERIAFIQVKTGCTGDECAYKGNVQDAQYELKKSSAEWREFRLWVFDLHVKTFQETQGPKIDLLFNSVGGEDANGKDFIEEWNWVTNHIKGGFGIKNGALSRGHNLEGERSLYNHWTPFLIDPKGLVLFRRSEMDGTWERPWYQRNVPLNFYWGAVNALNGGQSVWDITKTAIEASKELGFDYSFYFFNRYAGQIYPETATGAFCALHKGLDAADTNAYPEAEFGEATPKNVDRMLKICDRFSKYGAAVEDKDALVLTQSKQREKQTGFNDVGWNIWPDNYGRFLYQIDADASSIPLWRVGGPITKTSSIYSRFARGFEHASGKDAMYFKLHEGFSQGNEPKVMTITVVWYDGTAGSTWKLDYDAGASTMKTGLKVMGKGDQQWHHEMVTLNDAVFRYGGSKGSDLALVNTDAKDDIFSLIEVHRGKLETPMLLPPTRYKVYEKKQMAPKAEKTGKEKKTAKKEKKNENQD